MEAGRFEDRPDGKASLGGGGAQKAGVVALLGCSGARLSPGRLQGTHHPSGGLISSCPGVARSWGRAVLNQVKLWGGREYRELSIKSDVLSGGLGALLWGWRGLSGALTRAPGGGVV